ncbi:replication initiation protein [Chitinivorax sp. PXF-14]|uniref:replication initiation protein n=1 Tax=Chitinivorax sp. PXF-14 TaxID=3230488 RepID=UPI0034674D06
MNPKSKPKAVVAPGQLIDTVGQSWLADDSVNSFVAGDLFVEQSLQLLEQAKQEANQAGSRVLPEVWKAPSNMPERLQHDLRRAQQDSQYALDFYQDGDGLTPITDSKHEISLKRGNYHLRMIGRLGLLERQVITALHFIARPHVLSRDFHSVSQNYLKWLINHNTKDNSYLKKTIEGLQGATVWTEDQSAPGGGSWISIQVLGTVAFDNGILYFKIPEDMRSAIANPDQYGYISMRMNAAFNGRHARTLYDYLVSFKWRGYTDWWSVEEYRRRMGVDKDEYKEFKRLAVRVIKEPLDEIEKISDIKGVVEYRRENRQVVALRFKVLANPDGALALNEIAQNTEFPADLYDMLKADWIGSDTEINELAREYKAEQIREKIKVLTYRYSMQSKKMDFPGALLKAALAQDDKYQLTHSEMAQVDHWMKQRQEEKNKSLEVARERKALRKASEEATALLEDVWSTYPLDKQMAYWQAFLAEPDTKPLIQIHKLKEDVIGLTKKSVQMQFSRYLLNALKAAMDQEQDQRLLK